MIVFGFYAVIWGKSQEQNIVMDDRISSDSSSQNHKVPLLQSHVEEIEAFSADNQVPRVPKSIGNFYLVHFSYRGIERLIILGIPFIVLDLIGIQ